MRGSAGIAAVEQRPCGSVDWRPLQSEGRGGGTRTGPRPLVLAQQRGYLELALRSEQYMMSWSCIGKDVPFCIKRW